MHSSTALITPLPVTSDDSLSPPVRSTRTPLLRKLVLALVGTVVMLAVVVACALGGAWWWSGTEGSLAQTLQSLAPHGVLNRLAAQAGIPLGQLSTRDVTGSLRSGGQIGTLEWQQQPGESPGAPQGAPPGASLVGQGLQLQWNTPALLQGRLQIDTFTAQHLTVTLPPSTEPTTPPQAVLWPLPVSVNFKVAQLDMAGAMPVQLGEVLGHYDYDSYSSKSNKLKTGFWHQLTLDSVTLAQGQYRLKAGVQAAAPMAVQATLAGRVRSVVPGGVALTVLAEAQVNGTLAGALAALDVKAQVRREGEDKTPPMLDATARIQPWAQQPVRTARLAVAQLNVADFWPQAPATRLSGTVQAEPKGDTDWAATLALTNALPGPWDRQRLPVQSLQAQVQAHRLALGTRWAVSALQAKVGEGELQGAGQWQAAAVQGNAAENGAVAEPWVGNISFTRLNPAALYSAMAPARLDGTATAKQQGAGSSATAFEVKLKSSAGQGAVPPSLQGLRLGDAHAAGLWTGDSVRLSDLSVQAALATVQAKGELRIAARTFTGDVVARFPGGSAAFKGLLHPDVLMAPASASSSALADTQLTLTLAQADVTWGWLQTLPQVPQWLAAIGPDLPQWAVKGQAEVALDWQGKARHLKANVNVPTLVLQAPATTASPSPEPIKFSALQLSAQGPFSAIAVHIGGVAEQAPYKVQLDSRAALNLATTGGTADITRLSLRLQDSARSLAGALQHETATPLPNSLPNLLQLRWKDGSFEALPGQLRLLPEDQGGNTAPRLLPSEKPVTLAWGQLLWDAQGLRTQGRLSQLPLTWVDWLAGPKASPLADMGLSGQLWFDGDWDVFWPRDTRTPVRVSAGVQRQRGNLSVLLDEGNVSAMTTATTTHASGPAGAKPVDVGLREASLRVMTVPEASSATRTTLQARLRWNTERAGVVDAEASTVLQAGGGDGVDRWQWPATAPVRGKVSAQLPQIGVWSLLAPPGWRMKGTLAAQATLSGTQAAPQWAGQVQADQLALRSVVDGIEFVNGQLRANLEGDKVVIERFALEGAGGAKTGGRLDASGYAQWAMEAVAAVQVPASSSSAKFPQPHQAIKPKRIPRIDMQVTLDKLRVSNRVDRRLVVSGQVQAQLAGARLKLRGALKANQAAFSLSDELTPRLGDDVVVRGPQTTASSTSSANNTGTATSPSEPGTRVIPDVQLDLDLGDNFAVEGSGLKARLQGTLQVRSTPEQPVPRLLGEVRTTSGSYRAYGVNLTLETGLLRFAGPYDNPTLDILAIRPNTTQRVGVQVTGTALAPILRLYAEPELPDTEKLSWLVLGRSAAGPGGEAAILQQAAMSLLGRPGNKMDGGIAGALGLDEVSYRSGGVASDGTVTSAAVSVGKRLSSKLYVVYGQSLTSSVGTVSILYELSKRLTVRAKAGEDNALELVFTQRYD